VKHFQTVFPFHNITLQHRFIKNIERIPLEWFQSPGGGIRCGGQEQFAVMQLPGWSWSCVQGYSWSMYEKYFVHGFSMVELKWCRWNRCFSNSLYPVWSRSSGQMKRTLYVRRVLSGHACVCLISSSSAIKNEKMNLILVLWSGVWIYIPAFFQC